LRAKPEDKNEQGRSQVPERFCGYLLPHLIWSDAKS
jgi:hypothetical protein